MIPRVKTTAAASWLCLMSFALQAAPPLPNEPIRPVPRVMDGDPARIALGRQLFFDRRLSRDGTIACADCHLPRYGGTDARVPSRGVGGAQGTIKAPTVFNARFNIAQFWDGRAETLEKQLDGPIHNPVEMASSWPRIIRLLKGDSRFRQAFLAAYPQGLSEAALKDALASFERSLTTPDSPFDRWLCGDVDALGAQAKRGYRLFKSYGCIACHQGVNLGGNLYQRMGVFGDYFKDRGGPLTPADLGRFNVTKDPADRFYFKVPSLRMVALEKHFFHDGSASSRDRAIQVMAHYQLGHEIPAGERRAIAAFLRSLLGHHPLLERE